MCKIKQKIYTGWLYRSFNSFGAQSHLEPCASLLRGMKYISIGAHTFIAKNIQLTAWDTYIGISHTPQIIIGDGCSIGEDNHITAINKIIIGNNVLTGKKVLITDNSHGISEKAMMEIPPLKRPLCSKGGVIIEDNVWIGEKASILPGVHIGCGSIIAANSVVTHDVPAYTLAAGIPARIIKCMK